MVGSNTGMIPTACNGSDVPLPTDTTRTCGFPVCNHFLINIRDACGDVRTTTSFSFSPDSNADFSMHGEHCIQGISTQSRLESIADNFVLAPSSRVNATFGFGILVSLFVALEHISLKTDIVGNTTDLTDRLDFHEKAKPVNKE